MPTQGIDYSTYFGGSGVDGVSSMTSKYHGIQGADLYIAGFSESNSVPIFSGLNNGTSNPEDVFVLKINGLTGIPYWGIFFGGTEDEEATDIDLDKIGDIYITGFTKSTGLCNNSTIVDGDILKGNYENNFIAKFNGLNGSIIWDNYLGSNQGWVSKICPVSVEARDVGKDNADVIELFWVYFPAAREALHDAYAFNDRNSAMPFSFDHLLNSRRFNGVIYKEENVYGDRSISQYMKDNAQNQLLESARVKEKIRDFESDMWNY